MCGGGKSWVGEWLWGGAGDSPGQTSGTGLGLAGLAREGEERGRNHTLVFQRAQGKGARLPGVGRDLRSVGQDSGVQELGIHGVVPKSVLGVRSPGRILHGRGFWGRPVRFTTYSVECFHVKIDL